MEVLPDSLWHQCHDCFSGRTTLNGCLRLVHRSSMGGRKKVCGGGGLFQPPPPGTPSGLP